MIEIVFTLIAIIFIFFVSIGGIVINIFEKEKRKKRN